MAKKLNAVVKLQLPAGKATSGPPVGSSLGPHGINIAGFVKEFNERTKDQVGLIIPVVMSIYSDRSFTSGFLVNAISRSSQTFRAWASTK